jgi:hypothetical protein
LKGIKGTAKKNFKLAYIALAVHPTCEFMGFYALIMVGPLDPAVLFLIEKDTLFRF